jgi:hypothetical protein
MLDLRAWSVWRDDLHASLHPDHTLSRLRTAYLHELQNKLVAHAADLEKAIEASTAVGQRKRLIRELAQIRKQQTELLAFGERLNNLASQKIAIDLDDGVTHNCGLFGDLLAEVKAVCGKDEE